METLGPENTSLCPVRNKNPQTSEQVAAGAEWISEASSELDNLLVQVDKKMRHLEVAMHGLCGRAKYARLILARDAGLAQANAAVCDMDSRRKNNDKQESAGRVKSKIGLAVMISEASALYGERGSHPVSDTEDLASLGFREAWDMRECCAQVLLLNLPGGEDDLPSQLAACQAALAVAEDTVALENKRRNAAEARCRALDRELNLLRAIELREQEGRPIGGVSAEVEVKVVAENASYLHDRAKELAAAQILNKALEEEVAELRAKGMFLKQELHGKEKLVEELNESLTKEAECREAAEVRASTLEGDVRRLQEDLATLSTETLTFREGAAAAAERAQQASNVEIAAAESQRQALENELKAMSGQLNLILPDYLQLKKALVEAEAGKQREAARAHKAEETRGGHEATAILHAEAKNASLEQDVSRLRADLSQAQMELWNWKKTVARDAYRAIADEVRVACRNRMAAVAAEKTRSEESLCLSDCDDAFSDRSVRSESSDGNWFPRALSGLALERSTRSISTGSFVESYQCGTGEVQALALATVLANEENDFLRAEMVALRGMLDMYQEDAEALQREVEIHDAQMELYEEGCQLEIPPNSCTQQACKGYCERLGRGRGCKYNHDCQIAGCRTRKLHGHAAHKRWLEKHNPKEAATLPASLPPAAAKPAPLPMTPPQLTAPLSASGGSSVSSSPGTLGGSPVKWFSPGSSPAPCMSMGHFLPTACQNGTGNSGPPAFMNSTGLHCNHSCANGLHDRPKTGGNRPSTPAVYGAGSVGTMIPPNVNPMAARMYGSVY